MKLSEAIMLGAATVKMVPFDINSCALGAACNAVGMERHKYCDIKIVELADGGLPTVSLCPGFNRNVAVVERWPWLQGNVRLRLYVEFATRLARRDANLNNADAVTALFDGPVCRGEMTLEQLVDLVAAVEPECGECCRFDCACALGRRRREAVPPFDVVSTADAEKEKEVIHAV